MTISFDAGSPGYARKSEFMRKHKRDPISNLSNFIHFNKFKGNIKQGSGNPSTYWLETLKGHQLNIFGRISNSFQIQSSLSSEDVMNWRENEDEWKYLERHFLTDIEAKVTIKTSLVESIDITVTASLMKPRLALESEINFGQVQLNDHSFADIRLVNPTNETVQFRLLISFISHKETYLFREKLFIQICFFMEGVSTELKILSDEYVVQFMD